MRIGKLLIRSLRHYRRTHAAAAMTAAVCTAVLTGALLAGDSVRAGLRHLAALRLGCVQLTLAAAEHPFGADLAGRIAQRTGHPTAAALMTDGVLQRPDGTRRINRVQVLGVDDDFFEMGLERHLFNPDALRGPDALAVNESLRARLGELSGDWILRLHDPSALSRDLIFSSDQQGRITLRVRVESVVPDEAMGRFGLAADQQPPLNLFVPRAWLAEQLDVKGRANLLLTAPTTARPSSAEQMNQALAETASLEDVGLRLVERPQAGMLELHTERLFIPDAAASAAMTCGTEPLGIFTYFVNSLVHQERRTPYSMVAAVGGEGLFDTLADDEIIINEWLADDLDAETGDTVRLEYFAISPTNELLEKNRVFRVRQAVPMLGFAADATLMPPFPGLADAQNCAAWDPAIPIDLARIRPEDEAYWDRYRGTPKAFVSLAAAQAMWNNRFGNLTAVRWPMEKNSIETLQSELTQKLRPEAFGLFFDDTAASSRQAGYGSTDFGGLFAGLSLFLIAACAIILALIFGFTVEQRSVQAGMLLATGWKKGKIYRLLLGEGAILALAGAVVGAGLGVIYTQVMMYALRTVWQDAVAGAALQFYWNPTTTAIGVAAGFSISMASMSIGLALRLRKTPIELLSGTPSVSFGGFSSAGRTLRRTLIGGCAGLFAASFYLHGRVLSDAGFFFLNGSLLLTVLVLWAMEIMRAAAQMRRLPSSPWRLAVKNSIRQPGRSVAVFLTVACGVFIVLGVGLNRKSPARYTEPDSGTGGFALWVETALPLKAAPERFMIPLRMRPGDDASCLNLNRAQTPTVLGVDPAAFSRRGAFSFRSPEKGTWELLNHPLENKSIPAIGDYATVYWGLGLNVGDTLAIQDDKGQTVRLHIVGILKESIFQGRLLVSEANFIRHFPSHDGYRAFLTEWTAMGANQMADVLSRRLADDGAEVISTETMLRDFLRVENTYLSIFLALGGLGLILGSAGAGLVLLFNVLDRRGELAMMQAMGFSKRLLHRLLLAEHLGLVAAGILAGGVSAIVAVLPSIQDAGAGALAAGIGLPLILFAGGAVWIALAAHAAMRRELMQSLRNE